MRRGRGHRRHRGASISSLSDETNRCRAMADNFLRKYSTAPGFSARLTAVTLYRQQLTVSWSLGSGCQSASLSHNSLSLSHRMHGFAARGSPTLTDPVSAECLRRAGNLRSSRCSRRIITASVQNPDSHRASPLHVRLECCSSDQHLQPGHLKPPLPSRSQHDPQRLTPSTITQSNCSRQAGPGGRVSVKA